MTVFSFHRHLWGILWRSDNKLSGRSRHLLCDHRSGLWLTFRTRKEARAYIENEYGYILRRHDLRSEPHGWKMPVPVKVYVYAETAPLRWKK